MSSIIFQPQYDQVKIGERVYRLPHQQYSLLYLLSDGKEHSNLELIHALWNSHTILATDSRTLRVHISQLRKRIGAEKIKTIQGGYKLQI